jgi:hypothetical protein
MPNAAVSHSRWAVQRVCHGRRQATSTAAAATTRSHATPAAGTEAKSSTASAAPTYCEIAPSTNSACGGSRPVMATSSVAAGSLSEARRDMPAG